MGKADTEAFVLAWQQGSSAAEVAETLGLPYRVVIDRAAYLRRRGVQLKRYARGRRGDGLDIEALNALLAVSEES